MERPPGCHRGELLVHGETRALHRRLIPPAQKRAHIDRRCAHLQRPLLVRRTSNNPEVHSGDLATSCATATSSAGRPITVTTSNSFISLRSLELLIAHHRPPSHGETRPAMVLA